MRWWSAVEALGVATSADILILSIFNAELCETDFLFQTSSVCGIWSWWLGQTGTDGCAAIPLQDDVPDSTNQLSKASGLSQDLPVTVV